MEIPGSRKRQGVWEILITIIAIALFLLLISYPVLLWESPQRLLLLFLPGCLIAWALAGIKGKSLVKEAGKWNLWIGLAIIAASLLIGIYFFKEYNLLLFERSVRHTPADYIIGALAVFLVMVATWKTTGRAIPIVAIIFLLYAVFGKYMPGVFHHLGLSWKQILGYSAVDIEGIFGTLPVAGFTLVAIFIFFASMVQSFGGLDYIIGVSSSLLGRYKWGLPQVSVIASLMFGTFSGSSAANAAGVGAFTIPLMKKFGIKPPIAGAIEAVASTGGQVMPPVMGVAAFLMADFLGVHYVEIVARGFAPAFLYYVSVVFSVYLITRRTLSGNMTAGQVLQKSKDFRWTEGLPIIIPIGLLLFVMAVFKLSVVVSGLYMVISFVVVRFIYDLIYSGASFPKLKQFGAKALSGITIGVSGTIPIMLMLATMGIVARGLVATGMAQKLGFFMVDFAGGHLPVLLLLILLVNVLFGMAVSTVVAYILTVLLAAPALQQMGVPLVVSHFTVFYLSCLSAITPPVAIAVAVTASIARAPYMRTSWEAVKLGLPLFILPFAFISRPGLVAASLSATPLAALEIAAGLLAMGYGIQGEFKGIVGNLLRAACIVLGTLGIFYPVQTVAWVCLAGGVLLTVFLMTRGRLLATAKYKG